MAKTGKRELKVILNITLVAPAGIPSRSLRSARCSSLAVTSPAAVMAGTHTDLDPSWFVAQAGALGVDLQLVEGGHFCLFEDTDRAVRLVDGNLRALGYLQ